MEKDFVCGDRLGKRDVLLAFLAGLVFTFVYWAFLPRGLDPSLWGEMSAAAGLRPPSTIFAGPWRLVVMWLLSVCGPGYIVEVLRIGGALLGGLSVLFVYLVIRQILAYLTRVKDLKYWSWIAPLFAIVATICFGAGNAFIRALSPVSPGALRMFVLVISLYFFLRFVQAGGIWRVLLSMVFAGILAGETLVGFLLLGVYYIVERLALAAAVNGKLDVDADPEKHLAFMPRWRMFFSFVFGFALLAGANITTFVKLGGLEACGWTGFDVVFRYAVDYYTLFAAAASPVGWVLAVTFALLPFVVSLVLFPMLCRNTEPLNFRLGLVLLFAGVLSLVQCGILPYTRLWSLSSGAVEINADFLECIFMLMSAITLALAASCFTLGCQESYYFDEDDAKFKVAEPRGPMMRNLVQVVVIVCVMPVVFRVYRPVDTALRSIVHDAVVETVRECGDAKFLFTDGRLDSGIELIGAIMGSQVKPLNMMSGPSAWDKYIRTRHFAEGTPDRASAEVGIPKISILYIIILKHLLCMYKHL